ncbi:hypothetical protein A2303_06760 [Candidatus Falkowbacteria bacterium RIFOXYB2_FULL_47_14]|nr:MAG: hypothetical protein A2468_05765 [Candidatus Falkowbacteria bacterium RIFOXYC2_FULL_46_15]OGF43570.1 MAG: hypothetical protein A2303_06760 [Candidatus Falkowbacteria bacterium RIFOXYB2_FULL_47_14]
MMNKIKEYRHLILLFFLLAVLIVPYFVFAATPLDNLEKVGTEGAGYAPYEDGEYNNTFITVVGVIIKAFLSLLGVIFIVLILFGGYNWMTAAGDEQKVSKAKDTISRALIGLIIVVGSFAIWQFISNAIILEI